MWSFGIVPREICGKPLFESLGIVEDFIHSFNTLLLDRPVESFHHAIDFGRPRVDELMGDPVGQTMNMEHAQELAPIVSLDDGHGIRKPFLKLEECSSGFGTGDAADHSTMAIPCGHVNDTHKAPPFPQDPQKNGVHFDMSWCGDTRCVPAPLASHLPFVIPLHLPSRKPPVPTNEFANRGDPHRGNPKVDTVRIQQGFDGVLVHGVFSGANTLDKRTNGRMGVHRSYPFRSCRDGNERSDMLSTGSVPFLPVVEGAFPDPEGSNGCLPPELPGMLNDFYPKRNGVMGIVHSS